MTLTQEIENIYRLLADTRIEALGLLRIENGKLITPLAKDTLSLFTYRSHRADELIEPALIKELVDTLKTGAHFKGINHIGFCYKVASKENEVKRIARQANKAGLSAYQEPSIDDAAWVFVGDIAQKIDNPLLEFLPHEGQTTDKWVDYWLPHIQFDIDTDLSPGEIEAVVKTLIHKPFSPYSINIDGITYIQRVNLGCIEGVNVMLDISTNNRDINYRRNWEKLA